MNRVGRDRKRLQARVGGRWVRNTLENTMGMRVAVCPKCGRFNPYGPGTTAPGARIVDPREVWQKPSNCHACGAALEDER